MELVTIIFYDHPSAILECPIAGALFSNQSGICNFPERYLKFRETSKRAINGRNNSRVRGKGHPTVIFLGTSRLARKIFYIFMYTPPSNNEFEILWDFLRERRRSFKSGVIWSRNIGKQFTHVYVSKSMRG